MFFVVVISVTKEGIKFSTRGDIGTANIVCRQNTSVDKVIRRLSSRSIKNMNCPSLINVCN